MHRLLDILPDDLRALALSHPAFAASRAQSFERLEFLGDSVLGLVVTEAIYARHPEFDEGDLSRIRAAAVSRDSCATVARAASLEARMVEHASRRGAAFAATATRLSEQRNAQAALTESVIGAGFLAHGYAAAAPLVLAAFEERISWALDNRVDARSRLQELASREGVELAFDGMVEEGPPHDRRFTVEVRIVDAALDVDGSLAGGREALGARGTGRSKQEAQQVAAAALLALMDRHQG